MVEILFSALQTIFLDMQMLIPTLLVFFYIIGSRRAVFQTGNIIKIF